MLILQTCYGLRVRSSQRWKSSGPLNTNVNSFAAHHTSLEFFFRPSIEFILNHFVVSGCFYN